MSVLEELSSHRAGVILQGFRSVFGDTEVYSETYEIMNALDLKNLFLQLKTSSNDVVAAMIKFHDIEAPISGQVMVD